MSGNGSAETCRLCGGQTTRLWSLEVLRAHEVSYFECADCGSLQTETPYWLDNAYSSPGIGVDTGSAQRSIDLALRMSAFLDMLGVDRAAQCLDFGAGSGLYGRMMRDRGWDYYAHDRYSTPFYMDAFSARPAEKAWTVISAFEVLEHLTQPAEDLESLLGGGAGLFIFTTELWRGQGPDWPYLAPLHGQHVFFYSPKAIEGLAARVGRQAFDLGFALCLALPESREALGKVRGANMAEAAMASLSVHQRDPYRYAASDSAALFHRGWLPGGG